MMLRICIRKSTIMKSSRDLLLLENFLSFS
uniref:Uncharacterized protein n=1 Tax=Arundo donax TaxID=35708 RepID=A0A0A8ZZK1_ARUDO